MTKPFLGPVLTPINSEHFKSNLGFLIKHFCVLESLVYTMGVKMPPKGGCQSFFPWDFFVSENEAVRYTNFFISITFIIISKLYPKHKS